MAKILVSEKVHPAGPAMLVEAGHEVVYLENRDQAELAEKIKEVDAVFVRVMDITREMMDSAPNLKMISKHGVGVDNIDMEAAKEKGIVVTITPGANSQAVAEHAFALLMGVSSGVVLAFCGMPVLQAAICAALSLYPPIALKAAMASSYLPAFISAMNLGSRPNTSLITT